MPPLMGLARLVQWSYATIMMAPEPRCEIGETKERLSTWEGTPPVTSYAVDQDHTTLLRIWATGRGQRASVLGKFPDAAAEQQQLQLAATLTSLSEALWRCYTHPASAADDQELNSEGWRRQQTREAFTEVIASIKEPNLPDEDGSLIVSYDP
jgi:hypothetical protein